MLLYVIFNHDAVWARLLQRITLKGKGPIPYFLRPWTAGRIFFDLIGCCIEYRSCDWIQNGFYVQPAVGRDTSIDSDDDERRRAAHLFRPRNAGQQEAPETRRGPTLLGEQRAMQGQE